MTRLIDPDALKAYLRELGWITDDPFAELGDLEEVVDNAPTVEAYVFEQVQDLVVLNKKLSEEIRPHGEWEETVRRVQVDETDDGRVFETRLYYSCPICGAEYGNRKPEHPFCKWCGAKMQKEGEVK